MGLNKMEKMILIEPVTGIDLAEGMMCDPVTGLCGPVVAENKETNEDVEGIQED